MAAAAVQMTSRDETTGVAKSPVRFGRIPLWLYESGAPLQAIAAYGWLHGRYGHHGQVTPSYGTLAKELRVSRGSAIAYVQSLVSVGALRVKMSGATNHRSNTYEIAFEAPFPDPGTGQYSDQSNRLLVSPVTSTGQNTDQLGPELVSPLTRTGQPVGHDIDEVQDNYVDKTSTAPTLAASTAGPSGTGEAAAGDGYAEQEPNPDAEAVIDKLDLQRQPGRSERAQLLAPIAAALAAGWSVPDLVATLGRDWTGANDRVRTAIYRAKDLGAPRRKAGGVGSDRPKWCGQCDERTRMAEDANRHPERCPDCHPHATPTAQRPTEQPQHTEPDDPADPMSQAFTFLTSLPAPWTPKLSTAARLNHPLARAVTALGWDYDDQLTKHLTEDHGEITDHAATLNGRILALAGTQTVAKPAATANGRTGGHQPYRKPVDQSVYFEPIS